MGPETGLKLDSYLKPRDTINCRGQLVSLATPGVMGIINLTPDSFYGRSRYNSHTLVLNRVEEILAQGGCMVDVGAYSSRPGALHIPVEEEVQRLMPYLESIVKHFPGLIISVDTFRSRVAMMAVQECGASIVNDISGGDMDENMFETIAGLNVPYILTHMQGTPLTMQNNPVYSKVPGDILLDLARKTGILRSKGVNDIIIDPGFGFGKTIEQNYRLLDNLDQFLMFELPILVGLSRKSMIYRFLNIPVEDSLNGTTVLNVIALQKGAKILRVHDVKEAVECIKLVGITNM